MSSLLLDDGNPEEWEGADAKHIVSETALNVPPTSSPISLVRRAEYLYNRHMHEEAYHLARQVNYLISGELLFLICRVSVTDTDLGIYDWSLRLARQFGLHRSNGQFKT